MYLSLSKYIFFVRLHCYIRSWIPDTVFAFGGFTNAYAYF